MAIDMMHPTTIRQRAVDRPAGIAALAVIVFAAGLSFGAVLGVNIAPDVQPASVGTPTFDPDAGWYRDYRDGEIGLDRAARALLEHRRGEINTTGQ